MSVVDSTLATKASTDTRAWRVLGASTFAFTICFAIWMVFAILGIPLKKQLHLTDTEFGLIAATPVLTGSLLGVPLGIWTDRFGGRIVLFCTMAVVLLRTPQCGHALLNPPARGARSRASSSSACAEIDLVRKEYAH